MEDASTAIISPSPKCYAAILRALADELTPAQPRPWHPSPELMAAHIDLGRWIEQQQLRERLLAEADRAETGK